MSIRTFSKIEIIGFQRDKVKIIESLKNLGLVHITNLNQVSLLETEYDSILDKLYRMYENLKPIAPKSQNIFLGERVIIKNMEKEILSLEEINSLYEKIRTHLNNMRHVHNEIHTLNHKIEQLSIIKDLEIPLEKIVDGEKTIVKIIIIPTNQIDGFLKLRNKFETLYIEKINELKNQSSLLMVFRKKDRDKINEFLNKLEYDLFENKNLKGLPGNLIEKYHNEIDKYSKEISNEKDVLSKYLKYLNKIKISIDYYENEREKLNVAKSLSTTEKTFYIEGYVPEDSVEKIKQYFSKNLRIIYVNFKKPSPKDKVPVELKNSEIISFYESITNMYGTPNYTEVDPTPLISLFFTFFFGFCLTDAGYGLVIVLFFSFIIFNKKIKKYLGESVKIFYVFFFSGIAAMIMGAITGGFFGIPLPKFISRYVPIDLNVNNLNKSAIPFLKFAIYLGALQVAIGFILNMIKEIKRKNAIMGILQNLPNVIIIYSGIKLAAALMGTKVNTNLWLTLFSISILLNIIFSAPESKGIKRILKGLYNAFFGFTGLMGDILSYMRLFALGLATGILIFVINTVAGVMVQLLGVPGYLFAIILLIFGHLINILLNSLGAFVHSLRLQFVEFFQKFFEGGGSPYSPLKNKYRFTIFEKEEKK